jgi:hypothetical protein
VIGSQQEEAWERGWNAGQLGMKGITLSKRGGRSTMDAV